MTNGAKSGDWPGLTMDVTEALYPSESSPPTSNHTNRSSLSRYYLSRYLSRYYQGLEFDWDLGSLGLRVQQEISTEVRNIGQFNPI